MPSNRRNVPRDVKVDAIVSAALRLFAERGFEATTMPAIADAAGVAPNSIYWYFSMKDDLFAAVMDRLLVDSVARRARIDAHEEPAVLLVRAIADMRAYRSLHISMHERMLHSAEVRAAHERFLDWMRSLVRDVARRSGGVPDVDLLTDVVVAVFEGVNVPGTTDRPASELLQFTLNALGLRPSADRG